MGTRRGAWLATSGSALMWGANGLGINWPIEALWAATLTGGIGFVILLVSYYCDAWRWLRTWGIGLGPAVLITVCLLGLVGGIAWGWATRKPVTLQTINPFDNAILLECSWAQLPKVVPPDGLTWFQLSHLYSVGDVIPVGTTSIQPGSPMNWDPNYYPEMGFKCTFTNYSSSAVLNVDAKVKIDFLESVKTDNGTKSGEILRSQILMSHFPSVGKDGGTSTFYLVNLGPSYASVRLPKTIRFQLVGNSVWQQATLIPPKFSGMALSPYVQPESKAEKKATE